MDSFWKGKLILNTYFQIATSHAPCRCSLLLKIKIAVSFDFLTQTPLASSLYFPFNRIHFLRDAGAQFRLVAFSGALHAWINGVRGLDANFCPQINTLNAHWLVHKLPAHIWGQNLAYRVVVLVILQFQHRNGFFPPRSVPQTSLLVNEAWWVYRWWLLTTKLCWDSQVLQPEYRISDMNTQGFIGPTRTQDFACTAVQRVRRSQRLSFVGSYGTYQLTPPPLLWFIC